MDNGHVDIRPMEGFQYEQAVVITRCLSGAPPSTPLLAALSDAAVPLPVLPKDACGILSTISAGASRIKTVQCRPLFERFYLDEEASHMTLSTTLGSM